MNYHLGIAARRDDLSDGTGEGNIMKNLLKTVWTKFVNYLNTAPAGSGDHTALGSYAGLCGIDHNDHDHH
jgi:hypothetical protein